MRNSDKEIQKGNEKTGEEVSLNSTQSKEKEVSKFNFSFIVNNLKILLLLFFIIYDFCEEKTVSIIFLEQSPYVACQAVKTRASVVGRVRFHSYLLGFVWIL